MEGKCTDWGAEAAVGLEKLLSPLVWFVASDLDLSRLTAFLLLLGLYP